MKYQEALKIAQETVELLRPHCERIEIAGSIRREKPEPNDIEIVAIPKPYEVGLFESGLAVYVNRWKKVKGELNYGVCRYTQRVLPQV
jgi:DNA polymerase/3'-5' exonuclease PolX